MTKKQRVHWSQLFIIVLILSLCLMVAGCQIGSKPESKSFQEEVSVTKAVESTTNPEKDGAEAEDPQEKVEQPTAEKTTQETTISQGSLSEEKSDDTSSKVDEKTLVRVAVPKGPMALPALRLQEVLDESDIEIEVKTWDVTEDLLALIQSGQTDVFALPLNAGALLYNKGVGVTLMNVDLWGLSSLVSTDESVRDWQDLKGKVLYVPAQGSPPDALTQLFLGKVGLEIGKDVTIQYAAAPEVAELLMAGKAQNGILIEPQLSRVLKKNQEAREVLAFTETWKEELEIQSELPTAGYGVRQQWAKDNPTQMAILQKAFREAVRLSVEDSARTAELAEERIGLKAPLIQMALPRMGLHYQSAQEAKEAIEVFYQILMDFNPKLLGGKLPVEDFYWAD